MLVVKSIWLVLWRKWLCKKSKSNNCQILSVILQTKHFFSLSSIYNVCMVVYVEYVFLDNFSMDCLLLWLALVTLKLPIRWYRVVVGGAVGAICAIVSVYFEGIWLITVKLATLLVMCISVVGWGKRLFWYILLVLAYTFLMGGAIIGIFNLFNVQYIVDGAFVYNGRIPIFLCIFALLFVCFLCYSLHIFVLQSKKVAAYVCRVTVTLQQKSYNVTAFWDSGNTLEHKGLPVCFVTKRFGDISALFSRSIMQGKAESIPVVTVAGQTSVIAMQGTLQLEGKQRAIWLALPKQKCKMPYNVLLNNNLGGSQ